VILAFCDVLESSDWEFSHREIFFSLQRTDVFLLEFTFAVFLGVGWFCFLWFDVVLFLNFFSFFFVSEEYELFGCGMNCYNIIRCE
jgi:hypothetical protein